MAVALEWTGKGDYNLAKSKQFYADGQKKSAGETRSVGTGAGLLTCESFRRNLSRIQLTDLQCHQTSRSTTPGSSRLPRTPRREAYQLFSQTHGPVRPAARLVGLLQQVDQRQAVRVRGVVWEVERGVESRALLEEMRAVLERSPV